jgi:hypothetical protein
MRSTPGCNCVKERTALEQIASLLIQKPVLTHTGITYTPDFKAMANEAKRLAKEALA